MEKEIDVTLWIYRKGMNVYVDINLWVKFCLVWMNEINEMCMYLIFFGINLVY